jgi:hypothetical protein
LFLKNEIDLKVFEICFWDFFEIVFLNISEKTTYFNIGLVFYSVNIQPDIMQNE